jgi:hypothetical protein
MFRKPRNAGRVARFKKTANPVQSRQTPTVVDAVVGQICLSVKQCISFQWEL